MGVRTRKRATVRIRSAYNVKNESWPAIIPFSVVRMQFYGNLYSRAAALSFMQIPTPVRAETGADARWSATASVIDHGAHPTGKRDSTAAFNAALKAAASPCASGNPQNGLAAQINAEPYYIPKGHP